MGTLQGLASDIQNQPPTPPRPSLSHKKTRKTEKKEKREELVARLINVNLRMLFCVFLSTQSFGIFLERGFESILSIGLSPKLWILDDRTKISTWDAITPFVHLLVCRFYYQTIQKPRNHQAKTDIQNKSSSSDRTRRKEKATKILSVRVRIDH